MSTDAIVVLKEDHKAVKKLFRAFEKIAETGTPRQRGVAFEPFERVVDGIDGL